MINFIVFEGKYVHIFIAFLYNETKISLLKKRRTKIWCRWRSVTYRRLYIFVDMNDKSELVCVAWRCVNEMTLVYWFQFNLCCKTEMHWFDNRIFGICISYGFSLIDKHFCCHHIHTIHFISVFKKKKNSPQNHFSFTHAKKSLTPWVR